MRYRTQGIAYWYFAVAMLLFGLQVVFGLLLATKYIGPDVIETFLPFDRAKAAHTNLLIVWVLTGFMGAAYYVVPEESRCEIYSPKLAFVQLGLWSTAGVIAVVGYLFGWTTGNKFLEQPLPIKLAIVVVMGMFLFNVVMTIRKAGRLTVTEGVLITGLALAALLYVPALFEYDNYTVSIYYRWWTVHLWVEGVWVMIQGALLAFLLIRLSGVDREVMEKWLYVIVGLALLAGILGIAHHYYWIGVPQYWLPIGTVFSALEPVALLGMAMYAYFAMRRAGARHPNGLAVHWTIGSALVTFFGAGILGLAHTWPSVNQWTHGTMVTAMHGHPAFFGAYVMIVLAMISYMLPYVNPRRTEAKTTVGYFAFWTMLAGMFGMTMAFGSAGIAQTYLERIIGVGYLETQLLLQVHFLMLTATGSLFAVGAILFIYDFFRFAPDLADIFATDPDEPIVHEGI